MIKPSQFYSTPPKKTMNLQYMNRDLLTHSAVFKQENWPEITPHLSVTRASLFGSQGQVSQKTCAPKAGHIHLAHLSPLIGDSGKRIHHPDLFCLAVYTAAGKIFP